MRTVVATTLLSLTLIGGADRAAAQDPAERKAVPRSESRPKDAQTKSADRAPARAADRAPVREPKTAADTGGAARRARPEAEGARRPAAPVAAASTSAPDQADDQGRRGAVRRPPSTGAAESRDSSGGAAVTTGPGGGRTTGRAIPRSEAPPRPERPIYVYPDYYRYYNRYYDPWGYGAFGLGYFYYSPWGWSPGYYGYYGYGAPRYSAYGYDDVGRVKLKVKPRDAEVFVDGYFAGVVDDFDGTFQALKLDSGGYRIEVRRPGFEPLLFDVRVQPDRTITFRGEMKPTP